MLLLTAPPAFAQTSPVLPSQIIDEGLRRQEERDTQQQRSQQLQADVLSKPQLGPLPAVLPDETPCFSIDEITLEGPSWQRFHWLLRETEPYLTRCVGVQGLKRIVSTLDAVLIEQGYATTRIALPPQNLSEGRLRLALHVGRISEIRMVRSEDGKAVPDDRWGTWMNAFPVSEGDVLNVRELEQGLEQMKRLPSQSVTTQLEPGEQPDTSVLVIRRETGEFKDRLHGGVTVDNSGSASLGRTQLFANLALDNALGLNDLLNVGFNTNAESPDSDHRSQTMLVNYIIPWGYSALSLNWSRNEFAQIVQGTTAQFLSSGNSESLGFRWQHVALRTASSKSGFWLGLWKRRANSYLDDVELVVQQRHTTNVELGVAHRQLIGEVTLDADIAYRRGTPWLNAQEDLPTSEGNGLTLRPHMATFNAMLNWAGNAGGRNFLWSSMLHGQLTHDMTLSIDQIAIGGRGSVRGFDGDRVLLAESGWIWRNELALPFRLIDGIETSGYAAFDAGRVWGPSAANLVGNALVGAALGVRAWRNHLQFDAALGVPVYKPDGFVTAAVTAYVSATYSF